MLAARANKVTGTREGTYVVMRMRHLRYIEKGLVGPFA